MAFGLAFGFPRFIGGGAQAPAPVEGILLLENDDALLLEDDSFIALE